MECGTGSDEFFPNRYRNEDLQQSDGNSLKQETVCFLRVTFLTTWERKVRLERAGLFAYKNIFLMILYR